MGHRTGSSFCGQQEVHYDEIMARRSNRKIAIKCRSSHVDFSSYVQQFSGILTNKAWAGKIDCLEIEKYCKVKIGTATSRSSL
jgi:hypothetical protein